MCECYQVGGPFVAEDPECPVHGHEARRERERREAVVARVRRALHLADRVVRHYGANYTACGRPHPQQQALDEFEEALQLLDTLDL